jgi:hypothetical protein
MRHTILCNLAFAALATTAFVLGASGCTVENPSYAPGRQSLAGPLRAAALDVAPSSRVAVHEEGLLNPDGSDVRLAVEAADIRVRVPARGPVVVEGFAVALADRDRAPDAHMPDGLRLRDQRLVADEPLEVTVIARGADRALLRAAGRLRWEASMLLRDGTRYRLGGARTIESAMDLSLSLDDAGAAHLAVEAAPAEACAEIGSIMTLSSCVLTVEATAQIEAGAE